jgi:hypothetical protein
MILIAQMKKHNSKPEDCKIYREEQWQPHGYLAIVAVNDGNVVGVISQDMYAAQCLDSIKEAEKYLINKVNKLYDN